MPDLKDDPEAIAHLKAIIGRGYSANALLAAMVALHLGSQKDIDPSVLGMMREPENPFNRRVEEEAKKILTENGIRSGVGAPRSGDVFPHMSPRRRSIQINFHPERVLYEEIRKVAGREPNDRASFTKEQIAAVEDDFDGIVFRATAQLFPAKANA